MSDTIVLTSTRARHWQQAGFDGGQQHSSHRHAAFTAVLGIRPQDISALSALQVGVLEDPEHVYCNISNVNSSTEAMHSSQRYAGVLVEEPEQSARRHCQPTRTDGLTDMQRCRDMDRLAGTDAQPDKRVSCTCACKREQRRARTSAHAACTTARKQVP